MSEAKFESWAVVELMGHVRMAGRVTEEEHFGAKLGRIDIPKDDGFFTQYFGGQSVYRMTPVTEEAARAVAARNVPEPVHTWELPKPALLVPTVSDRRLACGHTPEDGICDEGCAVFNTPDLDQEDDFDE